MNTKVKGDKIKEGSIPLVALADDVKGNFYGKYGLNNYLGQLTDTNPLFIEGPRTFIYMLANNKIYRFGQSVYKVTLSGNGPSITITGSQTSEGWTFTASGNTVALYEVKFYANKVDVETPTPDWNAKKGEAGFIENRPFYDSISNIESIDFTGNNKYYFYHNPLDGAMNLPKDRYLMYNEVLAGTATGEKIIVKVSDLKVGDALLVADPLGLYNVAYEVLYTDPESSQAQIGCSSDGPSHAELNQLYNFQVCDYNIIALNDKYLPDTVLKTTPQTLSTNDKNQALANLGIDMFTNYKNLGGRFFDTPELYYKYKSMDRDMVKGFSYLFDYSGVIDEKRRIILIYGIREGFITEISLDEGVGNYGGDFELFNVKSFYKNSITGEFVIESAVYDDGYYYELLININSGEYKLNHVEYIDA